MNIHQIAKKHLGTSILILVLILTSQVLFGQKPPEFEVIIKNYPKVFDSSPTILDSVQIKYDRNQIIKTYKNITFKDSVFILTDVPLGKYTFALFSKGFVIFPLRLAICSKCQNTINFIAMPTSIAGDNYLFDHVEIGPHYTDGTKALIKDFLKSLTEDEIKLLKESKDFDLHFFVTKTKEISDPSFNPSDLSSTIKSIILKGINGLTNWEVAIVNGVKSDGEFNLRKSLFKDL